MLNARMKEARRRAAVAAIEGHVPACVGCVGQIHEEGASPFGDAELWLRYYAYTRFTGPSSQWNSEQVSRPMELDHG